MTGINYQPVYLSMGKGHQPRKGHNPSKQRKNYDKIDWSKKPTTTKKSK